tara:strand:+ start:604 stop:1137 length:534 start_codon:yes stop_codon:yes gene_type:complete
MDQTTEKKPLFKPQQTLNTPRLVTLEGAEPFYSKEDQYGKMNYGYNVVVDGQSMTWFCSESVNKLIKAAFIKQGEEFSIEFKSGTNQKTNQPYKIWLLNGKNLNDLMQEAKVTQNPAPGPMKAADPVATPSSDQIAPQSASGIKDAEKLEILWNDFKERNPDKVLPEAIINDEDIPF